MKFKSDAVTLVEEHVGILCGEAGIKFGNIYQMTKHSKAYFAEIQGLCFSLEQDASFWTLHTYKGQLVMQGFAPEDVEDTPQEKEGIVEATKDYQELVQGMLRDKEDE